MRMVATKHSKIEKQLKRYKNFGITDKTKMSSPKWKKIDWTKFKIIVPTLKDAEELRNALHYLHDGDIDTNFVTVNQLVHQYEHTDPKDENTHIVVDHDLFKKLEHRTCKHETTYFCEGVEYCQQCHKAMRISSYREL